MSGDEQEVRGVLVGAASNEYGAFKTREGEQRPGGTTYKLYVVVGFDSAPVVVKCPDPAAFEQLRGLGYGAEVALRCRLGVNGNQIDRRLLAAEVVQRAPAVAVSGAEANGHQAAAGAKK